VAEEHHDVEGKGRVMDTTNELEVGTKEFEAALLLAQGCPKAEVARRVGVGRRTLYHWLKRPAFRATVDRLARERAEEVKERLGRKSLGVLEQALDADEVRPARFTERLSAARTALQVAGLAGPQAATVQIDRSAVLFYGAKPDPPRPEIDYLEISDQELEEAERDLRAVERALLGKEADDTPALPGGEAGPAEQEEVR
jgi:hypothetical protein